MGGCEVALRILNHHLGMLGEPQPISANTNTRTSVGVLDGAIANLCEVFDRGSLVAVPCGVAPDATPAPLLTESTSDDYLRRLATSNVAVSLGGRAGLVAIRFADAVALNEFLARNPVCAETLVTAHAAGPAVWLRAITARRAPLDLANVRVLTTGNFLIYDRHALRCRDSFLNIGVIKGVDLFALDWGPDHDGRVAAWLTTLTHGEFVRRTQRGHIKPKLAAWRDYLVQRLKATTAFDRATGCFWRRLTGEAWQPLSEQQLIGEVRQQVVSAPAPGTLAHSWCNDEWLGGMFRYLRRVLASEVPYAVNQVRAFARGALVSGRDVTVPELFPAYVRYCRERDLPVLPKGVFQKQIETVLRGPPWFKPRSKSVLRPTGAQNGFRGIALRSSVGQSRRL